jgi:hypothetical protein
MSTDNGRVLEQMTITDSSGLERDYWSAILETSLRSASVLASSFAEKEVPWELSSSAPVSIRAEEAWQITRGSPEVTIAIIDEGFDKSWLPQGAYFETVSVGVERDGPRCFHGTMLAGLIAGTRMGYPGVAPRCRLLGIELPSYCTDHEEATAFDLALDANAAVVCCGWGPPFRGANVERKIPPCVASSLERLRYCSRGGLGALTFFAVGNSGGDVTLDGYASHPAVTAVCGITHSGHMPPLMDRGRGSAVFAPVSDEENPIGGRFGVPQGASGAAALTTGAAALAVSANPKISAEQLLRILYTTAGGVPCETHPPTQSHADLTSSVIDAARAVRVSVTATTFHSSSTAPKELKCDLSIGTMPHFSEKERRFGGGEHTILGELAINALSRQYQPADPVTTLFYDIFASFTPSPYTPVFTQSLRDILKSFLNPLFDPSITIPVRGSFPFKYLVALAADHYGSPVDLQVDLQSKFTINGLTEVFDKEKKDPSGSSDLDLVMRGGSLLPFSRTFGGPTENYVGLLFKNASHFAGDNLLFYLSYHLLAVALAIKCAEESGAQLNIDFPLAVLAEAFAAHYLTDMFSAGHARVPRRAFLGSPSVTQASDVSRFLHQYEGMLGVFFTNALGYIWYAFGDGYLCSPNASTVYQFTGGQLNSLANSMEALNILPLLQPSDWPTLRFDPLSPGVLAATLAFVSLADVFRHMAQNFPLEASAQGAGNTGLLGYVLNRIPYALPTTPFDTSLKAALVAAVPDFGPDRVNNASLRGRLKQRALVDQILVKYKIMGLLAITASSHFDALYDNYLAPDKIQDFVAQQTLYLSNVLNPILWSSFLSTIPSLVAEYCVFPTSLTNSCEIDQGSLIDSWKQAFPTKLAMAITDAFSGVWGVGLE